MTRIAVITPTADQPTGMALLEGYMARQTRQPDQWIVADDGLQPAQLSFGQTHLVERRRFEGGRSLASNLLRGLEAVQADMILIMEHDDWYSREHIAHVAAQLDRQPVAGSKLQRYYNVAQRHWRVMSNRGSCLAQTGLRAECVPQLRKAAQRSFGTGEIGIDALFWAGFKTVRNDISQTTVGIKGLPGRKGLGMGHRPPDHRWTADPAMKKLAEWIGQDAGLYQ